MSTPLTDLALASAADVFAAGQFADLLACQSPMPGRSLDRGFGLWVRAIKEGSERRVVEAADEAKEEVAGHPYAEELTALIDVVASYTRGLAATRTHRLYAMLPARPFTPGDGLPAMRAARAASR